MTYLNNDPTDHNWSYNHLQNALKEYRSNGVQVNCKLNARYEVLDAEYCRIVTEQQATEDLYQEVGTQEEVLDLIEACNQDLDQVDVTLLNTEEVINVVYSYDMANDVVYREGKHYLRYDGDSGFMFRQYDEEGAKEWDFFSGIEAVVAPCCNLAHRAHYLTVLRS